MKDRVTPLAEAMNSKMILSCDVTSDADIDATVAEFKNNMVHVISLFMR